MGNHELERCLLKIQNGDDFALQTLYERTKNGVFAFVYSYLKNYHDSEDAMQTVYLKIKTGINGYKKGTNPRAWILQIAKNHSLNLLAKRKREESVDTFPEATYVDQRLSGGITETMQKVLSQEEFQIVTLHVLWGYKHREIGELLNLPTGTITSKYKRAVEKLKGALKEEKV